MANQSKVVFGKRLKRLRENKGLTLKDAANQLKLGTTTLNQCELGNGNPTLENLISIADFYGVSLDYLAGRVKSMSINSKRVATHNELGLTEDAVACLTHLAKGRKDTPCGFLSYTIQQIVSRRVHGKPVLELVRDYEKYYPDMSHHTAEELEIPVMWGLNRIFSSYNDDVLHAHAPTGPRFRYYPVAEDKQEPWYEGQEEIEADMEAKSAAWIDSIAEALSQAE